MSDTFNDKVRALLSFSMLMTVIMVIVLIFFVQLDGEKRTMLTFVLGPLLLALKESWGRYFEGTADGAKKDENTTVVAKTTIPDHQP